MEEFLNNEVQESLINNTMLELTNLDSISQSIEMVIKLTSKASHSIYELEFLQNILIL